MGIIKLLNSGIQVVLVILIIFNNYSFGKTLLSAKDKAAVSKFLPMVANQLPHDYMKVDTYLIRWIRAQQYDLTEAKDFLLRNIEWRKQNKMDEVVYNPKSAFAKEFPIQFPGLDRDGTPYYISDWSGDVRRVTLAGKREAYSAFKGIAFELAERKAREVESSSNNTEWIGIYDFKGLSAATHLCVQCMTTYVEHGIRYENNYPMQVKAFYIINAPRLFQPILQAVSPVLGRTAERFYTYGNELEWKRVLLKAIPADQLPVKYGGTLKNKQ